MCFVIQKYGSDIKDRFPSGVIEATSPFSNKEISNFGITDYFCHSRYQFSPFSEMYYLFSLIWNLTFLNKRHLNLSFTRLFPQYTFSVKISKTVMTPTQTKSKNNGIDNHFIHPTSILWVDWSALQQCVQDADGTVSVLQCLCHVCWRIRGQTLY